MLVISGVALGPQQSCLNWMCCHWWRRRHITLHPTEPMVNLESSSIWRIMEFEDLPHMVEAFGVALCGGPFTAHHYLLCFLSSSYPAFQVPIHPHSLEHSAIWESTHPIFLSHALQALLSLARRGHEERKGFLFIRTLPSEPVSSCILMGKISNVSIPFRFPPQGWHQKPLPVIESNMTYQL